MKVKSKILTWLFLLCLVILFGCTKTDDGSYVEPITSYERLMGKWKLTKIKEIDELARAQKITPDEIDLTSKFNFKSMIITFSVDTTNGHVPTAFTVEGDAPEIFIKEGYWDLDTPYAKSDGTAPVINVYSDQAKTTLVDKFAVTTIPGTSKSLVLRLSRISANITFLSYEMVFAVSK